MPFEIAPPRAPATFRLGLPPGEVFEHGSWCEAMAVAHHAVETGSRLLVLGAPGTGKSLLLKHLWRRLEQEGVQAHLVLHGALLPEADDPAPILVDEADSLPGGTLARLAERPNAMVLAALDDKCLRMRDAAVAMPSVVLAPLAPMDLARYVADRLTASGRPADLFAPAALQALAEQSQGLFRSAVVLAGSAMFFAQMRGAERVTDVDVRDAAEMRAALTAETVETGTAATAEVPSPPHSLEFLSLPARQTRMARGFGVLFGGLVLAGLAAAVVTTRPGPPVVPLPAPLPAAPAAPVAPTAPVPEPTPAPLPTALTPPTPLPPGPGRLLAPVAYRGSLSADPSEAPAEVVLRLRNETEGGGIAGTLRDMGTGRLGRLDGMLNADGTLTLAGKVLLGRREYACSVRGRIEDDRLVGEMTLTRPRGGAPSVAAISLKRT